MPAHARRLLLLAQLVLLALWLPASWASDIEIESASEHVTHEMLMVDADSRIEFSEDAIKAMNSGVPITIEFDLRIARPRKLLWDAEVLTAHRDFTIERHALSDQYVLSDRATGERRIHGELGLAIQDLARIRDLPIAEASQLAGEDVEISLRLRLAIRSLPGPLIPIAFISPGWHMSSGWYRWRTQL